MLIIVSYLHTGNYDINSIGCDFMSRLKIAETNSYLLSCGTKPNVLSDQTNLVTIWGA